MYKVFKAWLINIFGFNIEFLIDYFLEKSDYAIRYIGVDYFLSAKLVR